MTKKRSNKLINFKHGHCKFTPEKFEAILERIRNGSFSGQACEAEGVSKTSFDRWLQADESLRGPYAQSRCDMIESLVQEGYRVAVDRSEDTWIDGDNKPALNYTAIQRKRIQVDYIKWLASKIAPKIYGDKSQHEITGADGANLVPSISISLSKPGGDK